MKKNVVKNILLQTSGSFTDQIDHEPYNRFGKELIGQILQDAFRIEETGGNINDLIHEIVSKYVK